MKAEKFIFNHLPELHWIKIENWVKDKRSSQSSRLIVIAYAHDDSICVTHGWSLPRDGYKEFSHCKAGRLGGGSHIVEREDIIAVSLLCGYSCR